MLFILIGLFGSNEKVRASFYLFLYTLKTGVGYHLFKCKRVKFRGNPKGLVTKAVEKIPGPARLITRGKVILLNMKETKWVIADLNQTVFVKEQRVDGSSIKYNGKVYSSCRETGFWVKKKLVYLMLILGTDGHYSIQQHVT